MQTTAGASSLPSLADILERDPLFLERAVDTREASRITGVPVATLETLRSRGGSAVFIKRRKRVLYTRRALLEWMAAGERTSTSDPGPRANAMIP